MIQKFAGFIAAEKGAITSLDQAPIKSRCIATVGSRVKWDCYLGVYVKKGWIEGYRGVFLLVFCGHVNIF